MVAKLVIRRNIKVAISIYLLLIAVGYLGRSGTSMHKIKSLSIAYQGG